MQSKLNMNKNYNLTYKTKPIYPKNEIRKNFSDTVNRVCI